VHNGVKIVGYGNVPGRVAKDASALYAKNIFNFLSLLIDKENKKIKEKEKCLLTWLPYYI
jgi:NAD(P) transhydrogenase subunit alpha